MAYRPTAKTEARKKAQHKLLSDTAIKIVKEGGFGELTIAALATRADVATGTIYKYFADKAAVCTNVFQRGSDRELEAVREAAFPSDIPKSEWEDASKRLYNTFTTFSERALMGRRLAYALIAEPVDPAVEAERLKYRKDYADVFEELLKEGSEAGLFECDDTFIAATAIVGTLAETLVGPLAQSRNSELSQSDRDHIVNVARNFCIKAVKA